MAYIAGILTEEEEVELVRRGWTVEEAPKELLPDEYYIKGVRAFRMVWCDNSMFDVMNGPDWEKGPCERGELMGYNDKLDADEQIDMEEKIASHLFHGPYEMEEEDVAKMGRDILLMVLEKFRPDLVEE